MFRGKDLSNNPSHEVESSETKVSELKLSQNMEYSAERIGLSHRGADFTRKSDSVSAGFRSKPTETMNPGFQELTFSYLCDNNRLGFQDKDSGEISTKFKGKDMVTEKSCEEEGRVERDFLRLNDTRGVSSKREFQDDTGNSNDERDKKQKLETLELSLALPDVSLSLNANPLGGHKSLRNAQPLAPSTNNTQTTCSNDFTAASLSYSYSHQFSHNPSCSLTRNSTDFNDQIWNCGEGTNGSVHSRFRPIGDGVVLANHASVGHALMNGSRPLGKDSSNSLYRPAGSDNTSFFPSELPAKPQMQNLSGDSRGRALDQSRGFEGKSSSRGSRPQRILLEVVSESIPVMAQVLQDIPDETLQAAMEYLKSIITGSNGKDQLDSLQSRLKRRLDLTPEILSKAHRAQVQIMVSVKFGLAEFVSGKLRISTRELVEIFFLMRCLNVNCKSALPVDDCDCKICSSKKGFCSQCMCPVCLKFDCASNTCCWVGCDVCSHWCHAACGIEKNLIRPGPSLKGPVGLTEMQFHCLGCGHASEMFGFVKDVFICCAKNWGLQTLIKELNCVRKLFGGSVDARGKQLNLKAEEMITRLEKRVISSSDACKIIIQFFNSAEEIIEDFPAAGLSKVTNDMNSRLVRDTDTNTSSKASPSESSKHNLISSFNLARDPRTLPDMPPSASKPSTMFDRRNEDDNFAAKHLSSDGFDSLDALVRVKQAEARMFQMRADEARKEVEGYRKIARERIEKIEDEYSDKLVKLCLKETEEKRRKKLEELKTLESSHFDYYNMKVRMQADIAGLLERMEASKRQWV